MTVEQKLLIAISNLDRVCSEYWPIIISGVLSLLVIVTMIILAYRERKYFK